jgi:predicted NBD/HSP70 family sugar kinase
MQEHNAYIVLEFVKQNGPVSRAETARSLGFSKSAISNLIGVLLQDEFLEVVGTGHPATGRKSELLSFNPNAFFSIGVEIASGEVRCALINLDGRIIDQQSKPVVETSDVAAVVERTEAAIKEIVDASGYARRRIAGVGIMIPGIVDAAAGRVIYSSVLRWNEPVDLAERIEQALGIPVFLENDANALALAEVWVGRGGQFANVALLFLSEGVGGAFFSKSQVLRGRNYAGMEIGKMIVSGTDGPASVESFLSFDKLKEHFVEPEWGEPSNVTELYDSIRERARTDLESMRTGFDYVTDTLAQAIANLVAILNPDAVFLDSPLIEAYGGFVAELEQAVEDYLPPRPELSVRLFPASITAEKEMLGGAAVAMYRTRFRFIITGKENVESEQQGNGAGS